MNREICRAKQNSRMSYMLLCCANADVIGGVSIYVSWCACVPGPLPLSTPHATPCAAYLQCASLDTQRWHSPAFNLTNIIPHFSLYFSKEKKDWGVVLDSTHFVCRRLHDARRRTPELSRQGSVNCINIMLSQHLLHP